MEWIPWTVIIGVLLLAAVAGLSIVISKKRAEARGELSKKEAPAVEGVASAELVETAPPAEVEAVEAEVVEPQIAAPVAETALVEPIAPAVPEIEQPEKAASRLGRLRRRLADSNNALARALADLLSSDRIDDETWDDFETTLITSDLGVGPTGELVSALRQQLRIDGISDPEQARDLLRSELIKLVNPDLDRTLKLDHDDGRPAVLLVVGVNGTGKTTTVGKLGRMLIAEDKTVLFGAADTFRAAAAEQLTTWGERVGVETIRSGEGADPASVAFNAVEEGINRGVDVVVAPRAVVEQLLANRLVRRGSLVDLLRTPLVALVQAGRSLPPMQTEAELRELLLRTPSLAYPSSDGSDFIEKKLLPQLGIQAQLLPKSIKVFGPQVSQLVAAGEAELGLQALSTLAASKGVSVLGPLPAPWRYDTVYTAAATMHGNSLAGAQALLRFYQRETAQHNWAGSGWEAVAQPAPSGR